MDLRVFFILTAGGRLICVFGRRFKRWVCRECEGKQKIKMSRFCFQICAGQSIMAANLEQLTNNVWMKMRIWLDFQLRCIFSFVRTFFYSWRGSKGSTFKVTLFSGLKLTLAIVFRAELNATRQQTNKRYPDYIKISIQNESALPQLIHSELSGVLIGVRILF